MIGMTAGVHERGKEPICYITVLPPASANRGDRIELWRMHSRTSGEIMEYIWTGYEKKGHIVLVGESPQFPGLHGSWELDDDEGLHPTGCLRDKALERLIACPPGGTWTWNKSPRRRLTDLELEPFAAGKRLKHPTWAQDFNWQIEQGYGRGRLITLDAQGWPV